VICGEHGLDGEQIRATCPFNGSMLRHPAGGIARRSADRRAATAPWNRLGMAVGALAVVLGCDSLQPVETGDLRVVVTTIGVDVNPAGYAIRVDGGNPMPLAANDTLQIDGIDAGQHTVELSGAVMNCTVNGAKSAKVNVPAGASAKVAFTVMCQPLVGSLSITAASSGADLDVDGYSLTVDSGAALAIATSGQLLVPSLKTGTHTVALSGLAANCTVAGANPRPADVGYAVTTVITFAVTCAAVTGSLRIVTSTSGANLDPDGYTVSVDGVALANIGSNAVLTMTGLAPGSRAVTLTGAAPNCTIGQPNPRVVTVSAGATDTLAFAVACTSTTGFVRVTSSTTGTDIDNNGYQLSLDGDYYYSTRIGLNDMVTLAVTAGTHTIDLEDVAQNCTVSGSASRSVTVAVGDTVPIAFAISCIPLGVVQVTMPTSGTDPDHDGYGIRLDGSGYGASFNLTPGLTLTVTGLLPNTYTLTVSGVALNCDAATPNPHIVSVSSGVTTAVSIPVSCAPVTRLALASNVAGNTDVYAVNSDGGSSTRLTFAAPGDVDPAWSPDGSRIAFSSARDGNFEIYVMNADGSNAVRLTTSATPDYRPAWSPDGSRIVFTSERDGNAEIYVMNADGSGVQRLTTSTARDDAADWSPDGSRIAFQSERGGNSGIWVMNADGTGAVRLSVATATDVQPAWSPDGTKLAFSRWMGCYYNQCDYDLYVMNADGSGANEVTSGWASSDSDPTWSGDGRRIAFAVQVCDYYYGFGCYSAGIVGVRADGTDPVLIASGVMSNPAWRH